jgi:hypothetical protein
MKQKKLQSRSRILLATGATGLVLGLALPAATAAQSQTQSRPAQTQSAPSESSSGERPQPKVAFVVDGDPVMKLLPKDAIASVDEPVMVPVSEGDKFMRDEEMVLGVFADGEARAYSTWHLDHHEIVNDRLGETPIAATW